MLESLRINNHNQTCRKLLGSRLYEKGQKDKKKLLFYEFQQLLIDSVNQSGMPALKRFFKIKNCVTEINY
jgi:hypothetical protein